MKEHDATDPKNFRGSLSHPRKPMLETQAITRLLSHRTAMLGSLGSSLGDFSNSFYKSLQSEGWRETEHRETTVGSKDFYKNGEDNLGIDASKE